MKHNIIDGYDSSGYVASCKWCGKQWRYYSPSALRAKCVVGWVKRLGVKLVPRLTVYLLDKHKERNARKPVKTSNVRSDN